MLVSIGCLVATNILGLKIPDLDLVIIGYVLVETRVGYEATGTEDKVSWDATSISD